jgi:hypothetical protein
MVWKSANTVAFGAALSSSKATFYSMNIGSTTGYPANFGTDYKANVTPLSRTKSECEQIVAAAKGGDPVPDDDDDGGDGDGKGAAFGSTLSLAVVVICAIVAIVY